MHLDTATFSDQVAEPSGPNSVDLALQFRDGRSLRVSAYALGLASAVLDGLIEDIELDRSPVLAGLCSSSDWEKESIGTHVHKLPVSGIARRTYLKVECYVQTRILN